MKLTKAQRIEISKVVNELVDKKTEDLKAIVYSLSGDVMECNERVKMLQDIKISVKKSLF